LIWPYIAFLSCGIIINITALFDNSIIWKGFENPSKGADQIDKHSVILMVCGWD